MRIVNLVSPLHASHAQIAVQTLSRTITTLLRISGTDALVHWIFNRLLLLPTSLQLQCIPAFCAVLSSTNPAPLVQVHIILALTKAISTDQSLAVLDHLPLMSHEHLSALAKPTLASLAQLIKQFNYSPRSVQVAALLSPDHAAAENLLLNLIGTTSAEITLPSLSLALNALALLIIERADTKLLSEVLGRLRTQRGSSRLLHLFCTSLNQLTTLGQSDTLLALLKTALQIVTEDRWANELLWQSVSVSLCNGALRRSLLEQVINEKKECLEGLIMTYYHQFPLPSFSAAQWNSLEFSRKNGTCQANADNLTNGRIFIDNRSSILSVDHDEKLRITTRTIVGKHCWQFSLEGGDGQNSSNLNKWLKALGKREQFIVPQDKENRKESKDLLKKLPHLSTAVESDPVDCTEMYAYLQQCNRLPCDSSKRKYVKDNGESSKIDEKFALWRLLAADLHFIDSTKRIPANFARDLKHLDQTSTRELHKIAVIYVAKGQEDKNLILSNTCGSKLFDEFVARLGWLVKTGKDHLGYNGGLTNGISAPYYASADNEIIFHVSTKLEGDVTQKLKHLGNDEVHVVWSEHDRPYRRDTIATSFCDVLIVLYRISTVLMRVRIETQRPLEFGPLYDGAHVHVKQLPHLVRDTVLNASRAYRIARPDFVRKMNILPKKRWHVRTKENVARVRRDQKLATEEAVRIAERAKLAEQEFKVNVLRKNAEKRFINFYEVPRNDGECSIASSSGHVNFFAELEEETRKNYGTSNKEYEEEKRKEQEEFESKVGILKYLGEGSNEYTKQKSWYEEVPKRASSGDNKDKKQSRPVICGISDIGTTHHSVDERHHEGRRHKHRHKSKHKHKHAAEVRSSVEPTVSLNSDRRRQGASKSLSELRAERLLREKTERQKAASLFLDSKRGMDDKKLQRYSSQFNPELARQNRM
uniref:Rap-GAP domain-containing protein n=1 Tax=Syphacia muris TaxID=451379 RepID=A0A0N5AMM5_9BILA